MSYQHVLLIDDDLDDQEIFTSALSAVSDTCACTTMNSGSEALQHLTGEGLEVDLIFLDLNMPTMSGQQFLERIKREDDLKNIPVIILSTSSHKATIQATKDLGAHDFITKPDTFDELVDILKDVIN